MVFCISSYLSKTKILLSSNNSKRKDTELVTYCYLVCKLELLLRILFNTANLNLT